MAVKVRPHQVRSLNDIEVITPSCHAGRTSPYLVFTVLIAKGFPTAVKGRPYEVRFLDDIEVITPSRHAGRTSPFVAPAKYFCSAIVWVDSRQRAATNDVEVIARGSHAG